MKERIQKLIANAGVASRRAVEEMILQGRVAVNGQVRMRLPILIDPAQDKVTVDDEPVRFRSEDSHATSRSIGGADGLATPVYVIMNKPKGVHSTNVAQGEQVRAIDLLPPGFKQRVYPVGRLDADSEGLLLLTNDGELTNKLTHPKFEISKTYRAVVDGYVHGEELIELKTGIWLADPHKQSGFKTGRSFITIVRRSKIRSTLDITIQEGRNRQIRRMLAKVGHKVRDLTRIKMGPLELGTLKPGQSRLLLPRELSALRTAATRQETAEANKPVGTKVVGTKFGNRKVGGFKSSFKSAFKVGSPGGSRGGFKTSGRKTGGQSSAPRSNFKRSSSRTTGH